MLIVSIRLETNVFGPKNCCSCKLGFSHFFLLEICGEFSRAFFYVALIF